MRRKKRKIIILWGLTLGPTTAEKAVEMARSLCENQTSEKNVTETSIRALNDDTSWPATSTAKCSEPVENVQTFHEQNQQPSFLYLNKILLALDRKTTNWLNFCWLQTASFPKNLSPPLDRQLDVEGGSLATIIELKWCIKCAVRSTESGLSTKLQTSTALWWEIPTVSFASWK